MSDTTEAVMARVMQHSAIRTGTAADMDRETLRREMKNLGIVKLHYFADGRKVFIKEDYFLHRQHWRMAVENVTTGVTWASGIPYHDLKQCIANAEGMFGITEWNAI